MNIRAKFLNLPKPWWWVFSFWKPKWKHYGAMVQVLPGDPGYDDAPFEIAERFSGDVYQSNVRIP